MRRVAAADSSLGGFCGPAKATVASARTETLRWTHITPSEVAGFTIYHGPSSGNYQTVIDVPPLQPDAHDGSAANFERTGFLFNNFHALPRPLRRRYPNAFIRLSELMTRASPGFFRSFAVNYVGRYRLK